MSKSWIKILFVIAGIYDLVAGGVMAVASPQVFAALGVTSPDPGYIQFPALVVALFGVMFLMIAADPAGRREQILYGIGLKACFSGVVFWHWLTGVVAFFYIPLAWTDFAFLLLFLLAWRAIPAKA